MTESKLPSLKSKGRKLTEAEKEKIREAVRERYGNQKLMTPALFFRLGSMVLIILFSIGIIINLSRRSKESAHVQSKPKVIITIDTVDDGEVGEIAEPEVEAKDPVIIESE